MNNNEQPESGAHLRTAAPTASRRCQVLRCCSVSNFVHAVRHNAPGSFRSCGGLCASFLTVCEALACHSPGRLRDADCVLTNALCCTEGRVEADGTLLCSYHGWRYNGAGKCTAVPQVSFGSLLSVMHGSSLAAKLKLYLQGVCSPPAVLSSRPPFCSCAVPLDSNELVSAGAPMCASRLLHINAFLLGRQTTGRLRMPPAPRRGRASSPTLCRQACFCNTL